MATTKEWLSVGLLTAVLTLGKKLFLVPLIRWFKFCHVGRNHTKSHCSCLDSIEICTISIFICKKMTITHRRPTNFFSFTALEMGLFGYYFINHSKCFNNRKRLEMSSDELVHKTANHIAKLQQIYEPRKEPILQTEIASGKFVVYISN